MTDKNQPLPDPQSGPIPPQVKPSKPTGNAGGAKSNEQQGKKWGTEK